MRQDIEIMRIADFVGGDDARAHRRKAVLPFRDDPLPRAAAIARRHVVDHRIAEHMVQRVTLGDAARGTMCRSEEHTSELQSLMRISYAVFCLKKKTQKQRFTAMINNEKTNNYNESTHTASHKRQS